MCFLDSVDSTNRLFSKLYKVGLAPSTIIKFFFKSIYLNQHHRDVASSLLYAIVWPPGSVAKITSVAVSSGTGSVFCSFCIRRSTSSGLRPSTTGSSLAASGRISYVFAPSSNSFTRAMAHLVAVNRGRWRDWWGVVADVPLGSWRDEWRRLEDECRLWGIGEEKLFLVLQIGLVTGLSKK